MNGEVTINWTTASETNNYLFTVERSENGSTGFAPVTTVAGAGNSYLTINYSAIDHHPLSGTSYYRLKQTDFNGTNKYSHVVAVNCGGEIVNTDFNIINAYDNGDGSLVVSFTGLDKDVYSAILFDVIGQQITAETGRSISGTNTVKLNVSGLAMGIYMVTLRNDYKSMSRKVVLGNK